MDALAQMLVDGPGGPIGSQVLLMIIGIVMGAGAALAKGWNSPAREAVAIGVGVVSGMIVPVLGIGGPQAWVFPVFIGIIFVIIVAAVTYIRR